ncbi:VOC family protein [Nocardia terpenica]|uniref:VOC family protein n=1 Tax=Nocardia terpenica TaxID=455432 RepID=UPI0018957DF5|nr:VOC family protein [Nocardia terpenica]MBF6065865.1 VOC family protein [Nocardia terpenica]MBF6108372.1 VOC family protein [Nocardia terpenica]MBF6115980.1 VOC family protein [Nocardia terpenica]MBF6123110.1 VOC family protein [Nocardia terpenica]MBF6156216.1 VOC family protein [Nocardia terpenica]
MKASIDALSLAVDDVERAMRFYRDGLGLATPGIIGTEFVADQENPGGTVAMFTLDNGMLLSVYGRTDLATDAGVPLERVTGSAVGLGWFVDSRDEVDRVLARAAAAGGTIVRAPLTRPWGIYAGYFADPDGHLWEVVHFLDGNRPGE